MNKKQRPTDRYLILQYREGDTSVLPVLVKRYHRIFCEKLYWIIKDKDAAKDIAQESWITIIKNLDTLKNVDSFKSWALRIVYTKAIDAINLRKKENLNFELVEVKEPDTQHVEDRMLLQKALLRAI